MLIMKLKKKVNVYINERIIIEFTFNFTILIEKVILVLSLTHTTYHVLLILFRDIQIGPTKIWYNEIDIFNFFF